VGNTTWKRKRNQFLLRKEGQEVSLEKKKKERSAGGGGKKYFITKEKSLRGKKNRPTEGEQFS